MAIGHRQLRHVTRDHVAKWLQDWQALPQPRPKKRDYIKDQLEAIEPGLAAKEVDTSQRDDYADDSINLLQIIMDDVKSYG